MACLILAGSIAAVVLRFLFPLWPASLGGTEEGEGDHDISVWQVDQGDRYLRRPSANHLLSEVWWVFYYFQETSIISQ